MAEGSKNNLPKSMPSIPAKEREERLPLYLQRLVKSDFTQIPSRGTESFYELCLLCEASTEVEDPNLPDFLSTSYLRYKNFTIDIEGYIQAPGFVKNPYQDLPGYVKRATLPPMPWISSLKSTEPSTQDGTNSGSSRSSNRTRTTSLTQVSVASAQSKAPGGTTSRVPDNVRRLNTVEKFDMTDFSTRVVNYVNNLPVGFQRREGRDGTQVDVTSDFKAYRLSIPAFEYQTQNAYTKPPHNEIDVQSCIGDLIGNTVATLLHLCDPSTLPFTFQSVDGKGTSKQKSDLCWHCPPQSDGQPGVKRLVLEAKTPWTLDPITFKSFVDFDFLPTLEQIIEELAKQAKKKGEKGRAGNSKLQDPRYTKVQNMWAQVYDYCVMQGTYFFILTSYEYWVFGVFSVDYTSARVTTAMPFDSKDPTILACVMYWTQSAMLVPGLQGIPWVSDPPEPLARTSSTTLKDVFALNPRAARAIISVS